MIKYTIEFRSNNSVATVCNGRVVTRCDLIGSLRLCDIVELQKHEARTDQYENRYVPLF